MLFDLLQFYLDFLNRVINILKLKLGNTYLMLFSIYKISSIF